MLILSQPVAIFKTHPKRFAFVLYLPFVVTALLVTHNVWQLYLGNYVEAAMGSIGNNFKIKAWHRQILLLAAIFLLGYQANKRAKLIASATNK